MSGLTKWAEEWTLSKYGLPQNRRSGNYAGRTGHCKYGAITPNYAISVSAGHASTGPSTAITRQQLRPPPSLEKAGAMWGIPKASTHIAQAADGPGQTTTPALPLRLLKPR